MKRALDIGKHLFRLLGDVFRDLFGFGIAARCVGHENKVVHGDKARVAGPLFHLVAGFQFDDVYHWISLQIWVKLAKDRFVPEIELHADPFLDCIAIEDSPPGHILDRHAADREHDDLLVVSASGRSTGNDVA